MLVKIEARILIFPGTDFNFPSTSVPPGTFLRLWAWEMQECLQLSSEGDEWYALQLERIMDNDCFRPSGGDRKCAVIEGAVSRGEIHRREFPPWQPKLILFVTLIICLWWINLSLSLALPLYADDAVGFRLFLAASILHRRWRVDRSAARHLIIVCVNLARSPCIALGSFRVSFKDSTLIFCATPFQFPFTPPRR